MASAEKMGYFTKGHLYYFIDVRFWWASNCGKVFDFLIICTREFAMQTEGLVRDNLLSPSSPTHLMGHCKQSKKADLPASVDLSGATCKDTLISFVEGEPSGELSHCFAPTSAPGVDFIAVQL